jgi:hypothetical protein
MPHDRVSAFVLVNTFALWAVFQLSIAASLTKRDPRWRGGVALFVPPLALYWALREGMQIRAALWVMAAVGWVVVRVFYAR